MVERAAFQSPASWHLAVRKRGTRLLSPVLSIRKIANE